MKPKKKTNKDKKWKGLTRLLPRRVRENPVIEDETKITLKRYVFQGTAGRAIKQKNMPALRDMLMVTYSISMLAILWGVMSILTGWWIGILFFAGLTVYAWTYLIFNANILYKDQDGNLYTMQKVLPETTIKEDFHPLVYGIKTFIRPGRKDEEGND